MPTLVLMVDPEKGSVRMEWRNAGNHIAASLLLMALEMAKQTLLDSANG